FVPAIEHVTLVLGDDERETRDFRRKVAQFDAAKVCLWNIRVPIRFAAPLVDLGLYRTHFLVGDDEKVARAAGRIEQSDSPHPGAQVKQHTWIVDGLLKLRAEVVEEERIEHLQYVGHARVVHAERTTFLVLSDRLDHRPEDVRVDPLPIEIADVEKIRARDPAEAWHIRVAREQTAVDIGKCVGPSGYPGARPILDLRVHGTEQLADYLMGVRRVFGAHL